MDENLGRTSKGIMTMWFFYNIKIVHSLLSLNETHEHTARKTWKLLSVFQKQ
jgi:hypothetical protein